MKRTETVAEAVVVQAVTDITREYFSHLSPAQRCVLMQQLRQTVLTAVWSFHVMTRRGRRKTRRHWYPKPSRN